MAALDLLSQGLADPVARAVLRIDAQSLPAAAFVALFVGLLIDLVRQGPPS